MWLTHTHLNQAKILQQLYTRHAFNTCTTLRSRTMSSQILPQASVDDVNDFTSSKRQRSEETNVASSPAKKKKKKEKKKKKKEKKKEKKTKTKVTAQCIACNIQIFEEEEEVVVCVDCDDVWCKKCGNEDGVMRACVANENGEGCGENVCDGCFKTTYCGRDVECCKSCFEEYIGECGDGDCDTCLMGRARDGQWK